MICSSENLLLRIVRLLSGGYGLYPNLEEIEGLTSGSVEAAGRALGQSGDGGVDGVIDQDALGLDRIYIQAKRYVPENKVGPGVIRDFFGSLDRHKAAKGVFATASDFTRDAEDTAAKLSKRIVLISGKRLGELMIQHNVGCRIEETMHIKKIDEDYFDE